MSAPRGLLITFEGLDGCGKTTQARRLAAYLRGRGAAVVHTREPGGTRVGRRIRAILLGRGEGDRGQEGLSVEAELLLLMADRAQHVWEVIRPALERGAVVVCERYTDSSVAYQAFGLGVERSVVERLNELATGGLLPDLTIWLDLPAGERLGAGRAADRIESRADSYFERVREGYRQLARAEPGRFAVVAVEGRSREAIHQEVVRLLHQRLGARLQALLGSGIGSAATGRIPAQVTEQGG